MKHHRTRWIQGLGLTLTAGLLVTCPGQAMEAAREGIGICMDLIIPSLFPLMVLSSLFVFTGLAQDMARFLTPLTGPVLGLTGAGTTVFLLGTLGGYPVGARTLAQMREEGQCSPREARRLALFCNNCGPAFFLGAAGVGVFGSRQAGLVLWGSSVLSSLILAVLLSRGPDRGHDPDRAFGTPAPCRSLSEVFPLCVRSAFTATLSICAYVILFSVLTALADHLGLFTRLAAVLPGGHAQPLCRAFLMGLLELSTGTAALTDALDSPAALPMAAFILCWGGLSVHCQSLSCLRQAGASPRSYFAAKFLQGILAAGVTAAAARFIRTAQPAMAPLIPPSLPVLWQQEALCLWVLSGLLCLFSRKKGLVN